METFGNNKKPGFFLVLIVLMIISAFLVTLNTSNAATSLYVNDSSGNDSWDGTSPTYINGTIGPKKTIQKATDAVDVNGTVYVAEGIYKENLIIQWNLNLVGNGAGNSAISTANPDDNIITIQNKITNALITGFSIHEAGNGIGILIQGTGVTLSDNNIFDNLQGVLIEEEMVVNITGNNIHHNEIGIVTLSDKINVNFNRFNNYLDIHTEIENIDATYNWWGSNTAPEIEGVNNSPWLYMTITATPNLILNGATSQITTSFNNEFDGYHVTPFNPVIGHLPDGCQVTFTTDLGSVGSKTTIKNTLNGIASAMLTADEGTGTAHLSAELDSQIVNANVGITDILYVNGITGNDTWNGLSPTFISGTTGPLKTIQTAINTIVNNGMIMVAAGIYQEHLTIPKNITLNGAGSAQSIIDGTNNGRVITVPAATIVVINGLGLQNGNTTAFGGGISNSGNLTVNNSSIINCTANRGGGISNDHGILTINNSTLTGNTVTGWAAMGGAIYDSQGTVAINNSTLTSNTAPSALGGALCEDHGATNIYNSIFTGNSANNGGAIATIFIQTIGMPHPNHSPISIYNSIFTGNSAGTGGAIINDGVLTIYNSTLTGNTAGTTSAIHNVNGTVNMHYNHVNGTAYTITNSYAPVFEAQNNWWGTNSDPSSQFSGYVNYSPWLYMTLNVTPTTLNPGENSILTVSFNNIYDGVIVTPIDPAGGHLPDGAVVTISTDRGSVGSKTTTKSIINGIVTATLTALTSEGTGIAHVSALLENQNTTTTVNMVNPIRFANTITGNDSWDGTTAEWISGIIGPKKTIQEAINSVEVNGIVYLASGIFYEHLAIPKNLNIVGAGQNLTFIDGSGSGRLIYLKKNLTISGLTIQNFDAGTSYGGAIIIEEVSLTITNVTFAGNHAEAGGAIYNSNETLIINNCTFINNNATNSGGALSNLMGGNVIINNSTLSGNQAVTGGAIHNISNLTINNTIFTGNTATGNGGAIAGRNFTINYCNIVDNSPNALAVYSGNANAQNNWWGSNDNPSSKIYGSGSVNYSPWLYMTFTAEPNTILNCGTSILTADFNNAYDGTTITPLNPATGHIPDGGPVTFTTDLGSVGSKTTTKYTANGIATATLTADETPGTANLTAEMDDQLLNLDVIIKPVRYVNGVTGNDSWDGSSPVWISGLVGPMKTIQTAVNAIESNGTVSVAPDTYTENVVVEKLLQIMGDGSGVVTVQAFDTGLSVFTINTAGSGSTIQNLNITGGSNGISLNSANNCTILNNTITSNTIGILVLGNQNNITSNNATSNGWAGICLSGVSLNTVTNNLVSNNPEGIYILNCANNIFSSNIADNNSVNGLNIVNGSQNTITNNTVTNNGVSTNGNGIILKDTTLNNLDGNTVSGNGWSGIVMDNSTYNNLTNAGLGGNTITGNGNGLVLYGSSSNNTITGNNFLNNLYNGLELFGNCEYNQIHGNNITNTQVTGLLIQNSNNNNVTGNTVDSSSFNGVALDNANTNNIEGNNITSSGSIGLIMVTSNSNTIKQNQILSTFWTAIAMDQSSYNLIQQNTINGTYISQNGIWFQSNCNYNNITSNTITQNTANGVNIQSSTNNLINYNNISQNTGGAGIGLLLINTSSTTINHNTFQDNGWVGTCLSSDSSGNTITENNYITTTAQTSQAYDAGINTYDNETTGNYWNNWTTTDPRPIDGGSNVDNHPSLTPF